MRTALLLPVIVGAVLTLVAGQDRPAPPVHGVIHDAKGPVAGARVRLQGKADSVATDARGRFDLSAMCEKDQKITAWKPGYAIAHAPIGRMPLKLSLIPLPAHDNEEYEWIEPGPDARRPHQCGNCHKQIHDEWAASAHAGAARNRRLHNLVAGVDWHGKRSKTWSLADEHPLGTAVCATCHAPTYQDPKLEYDLTRVTGVAAKGVHCDYCHKVVEAPTDKLGTRFGRDGLHLLRPSRGEQLFFGPLDDAVREGEMFGHLPLYKESRYCASCHEGIVFGVHVYSTYSEWLESPARKQGQQCQDCHMRPSGKMTNIAPGKGGIERDPKTLASHALPGATKEMLKQCLTMKTSIRNDNDKIEVVVDMIARDVGHRVPTGFIDRHLLLIVEGVDKAGKRVAAGSGPKLSSDAGKDLAGLPGDIFARQLKSAEGRLLPFWLADEMPAEKPNDTRLIPGKKEQRRFTFARELAQVRVRLLYRRFWHDVAQNKRWPDNDILIEDKIVRR